MTANTNNTEALDIIIVSIRNEKRETHAIIAMNCTQHKRIK